MPHSRKQDGDKAVPVLTMILGLCLCKGNLYLL